MKRILVIAPQYIGDSILAIPFLRELKKHYGRVEIDVVSKNAGCLFFANCPYIANVYNLKNLDMKTLRANKYTKAYILKRSLSAALLAFSLGIKNTIGFGGQFRELFIKKVVKYNKAEQKHELEHFMDVLREDYVEITDKSLEYCVESSAKSSIETYMSEGKSALVVACSSTPIKNWTVENFSKAIDFLANRGYTIYFAGLEKEKAYYDEISSLIDSGAALNNLCGKLTFDEIAALIERMDLVFGIDSGFCHLGAALGKKVVTLFGPTSKKQWAPLGANSHVISLDLGCSPCAKPKNCKNNNECLQNLSADVVIAELERIL